MPSISVTRARTERGRSRLRNRRRANLDERPPLSGCSIQLNTSGGDRSMFCSDAPPLSPFWPSNCERTSLDAILLKAECPPVQVEPVDLSVNKNRTKNGNKSNLSSETSASEQSKQNALETANPPSPLAPAGSPTCIDLRLRKEEVLHHNGIRNGLLAHANLHMFRIPTSPVSPSMVVPTSPLSGSSPQATTAAVLLYRNINAGPLGTSNALTISGSSPASYTPSLSNSSVSSDYYTESLRRRKVHKCDFEGCEKQQMHSYGNF
ncbi:Krueppel-like factor 8 [Dinothrombium tinctorium]|uniref:Krueppel-like factor 8 n=1 Tax=Dinothrombium tinctorium TaxID=1965070 RepID=A0A3S3PHB0_9ACAR|nr:Krueppel-like factor 8 [Dinothrombium tinctorium]